MYLKASRDSPTRSRRQRGREVRLPRPSSAILPQRSCWPTTRREGRQPPRSPSPRGRSRRSFRTTVWLGGVDTALHRGLHRSRPWCAARSSEVFPPHEEPVSRGLRLSAARRRQPASRSCGVGRRTIPVASRGRSRSPAQPAPGSSCRRSRSRGERRLRDVRPTQRDDPRRERKIVGLDHDVVARARLFVPPDIPGRFQRAVVDARGGTSSTPTLGHVRSPTPAAAGRPSTTRS